MLCCVFWLVLLKCLGGKCLGGKFVHHVNARVPASMWMVRYATSSTPFGWHVRCDCSALLFIIMWHWHPLWFGSLLDSPAPFVMMQMPWLSWWSGLVVLNFSYRSEFDTSFLCVVAFVFVWSGSSSRGHLFILFVLVFVFVWASRSLFSCLCLSLCGCGVKWMNGWVGCLNQFLCCLRVALLECSACQGWHCLRDALLEGGAARGWHLLFTWIDDPQNICDQC